MTVGNHTLRTLTGDASYSFVEADGVVTVQQDEVGHDSNTRVVVAEAGSPSGSVCATINTPSGELAGIDQPGVALHVRSANGRTTALTLTNNIFYGARWIWNVHHMDSGAQEKVSILGSFVPVGFAGSGDPPPPLPWRVCARTVGNTMEGKVWSVGTLEPLWGDPAFGGSVAIAPELANGGESGVYAGHLQAGQGLQFSEIDHPVPAP